MKELFSKVFLFQGKQINKQSEDNYMNGIGM